jgi:hypothetical protein
MRNSAINIDNLANHASEAVIKRNSAIFSGGAGDASVGRKDATEALKTAFVAVHAKTERKMNKTEERFYNHLKLSTNPARVLVIPQPTRLFRFDDGDTYTPDFLCVEFAEEGLSRVVAVEVKMEGAHYNGWEQGYERYKRAKERFSQFGIEFKMAIWQPKKMQWRYE